MSITFSRSMRSLTADGFRHSIFGLFIITAFLGIWVGWFFLAQVAVYEVTDTARLEVYQAVHPIEAPISGRVVATHLELDKGVQAGDVLVELDAETERLQLEEERVRLNGFTAQLDALRGEVAGEEQVLSELQKGGPVALDEARARYQEAEVAARAGQEETEVLARLRESGLLPLIDFIRTKAEAEKRRAAADALRLEVSRLELEQQNKESSERVRLERLKRDAALLEGEITTAKATIERLKHEVEIRKIPAPVGGRLGEVANLRVGAVVQKGDKIGVVVPPGELKAVAYFLPLAALGRIRPGQPARLRLDGFPWTQYGSISATVANVASEARDGLVRVEFALHLQQASPIPFQHGLPGKVEVEVDRVSPALLVLRAAGKRLGAINVKSVAGNSP